MQAEELRAELSEVRAELKEVSASLEEAEEELEEAQLQLRMAEVAQEEQQQRCASLLGLATCHHCHLQACCGHTDSQQVQPEREGSEIAQGHL